MMTNTFATIAATVGLTCGLIACASPAQPETAQPSTATPPASTPTATAGAPAQPATQPITTPAPTPSVTPVSPTAVPPAQAPVSTGAMAPTTPAITPPVDPAQPPPAAAAPGELDHYQDIRGHCGLKTNFADDNACLIPPKPGEGIQIHVGPSNYDDPAEIAKFVMHPGEESSECFTLRTPNAEKIVYQTFLMSGRAGTHHMINTVYSGDLPTGSFGTCGGAAADPDAPDAPAPIGSLPGASKAYMARSKVAPEYAHVGRELEAKALMQGDMHYFNFTDKDILREIWINLYFPAPEAQITEFSDQIRGFGGLGWSFAPIEPGTDMVYKYECPIASNGKIMNLLGHYHAHGKRFTASIKRASGATDKVFEMFDYLDPATFDYNTVTTNPAFAPNTAGAFSGILDVSAGDVLQWECHIINDGNTALAYTNEVKTGEMCNVWGYSVGTDAPITCDLP